MLVKNILGSFATQPIQVQNRVEGNSQMVVQETGFIKEKQVNSRSKILSYPIENASICSAINLRVFWIKDCLGYPIAISIVYDMRTRF